MGKGNWGRKVVEDEKVGRVSLDVLVMVQYSLTEKFGLITMGSAWTFPKSHEKRY